MNSYNELQLLKLKHKYCVANNFKMFIIDNISNDGTKEYLESNNISHSFIDTDNAFDLRPLLAEMNIKLHEIKLDWFIYHGMDVFPIFTTSLQENIIECETSGFNQISLPQYTFFNLKEKLIEENPFKTYFNYRDRFVLSYKDCFS